MAYMNDFNNDVDVFDFTEQKASNAEPSVRAAIARQNVAESHQRSTLNYSPQTFDASVKPSASDTYSPPEPEYGGGGGIAVGVGGAAVVVGGAILTVKKLLSAGKDPTPEQVAAAQTEAEGMKKGRAERRWWERWNPLNRFKGDVGSDARLESEQGIVDEQAARRDADWERTVASESGETVPGEEPPVGEKPTTKSAWKELPIEVRREVNQRVLEERKAYKRVHNKSMPEDIVQMTRDRIMKQVIAAEEMSPGTYDRMKDKAYSRMTPEEMADFLLKKKYGVKAVDNPRDPAALAKLKENMIKGINARRTTAAGAAELEAVGPEIEQWIDAQDAKIREAVGETEAGKVVEESTLKPDPKTMKEEGVGIEKDPATKVGADGKTRYRNPEGLYKTFEELSLKQMKGILKSKNLRPVTSKADAAEVLNLSQKPWSELSMADKNRWLENSGATKSNYAHHADADQAYKNLKEQRVVSERMRNARAGKVKPDAGRLKPGPDTIHMRSIGAMTDEELMYAMGEAKKFFGVKTNAEAFKALRAGMNTPQGKAMGVAGAILSFATLKDAMKQSGAKWSDITSGDAWSNPNLLEYLGEEASKVGKGFLGVGADQDIGDVYSLDTLIGKDPNRPNQQAAPTGEFMKQIPGEFVEGIGDVFDFGLGLFDMKLPRRSRGYDPQADPNVRGTAGSKQKQLDIRRKFGDLSTLTAEQFTSWQEAGGTSDTPWMGGKRSK
jgi:hypothetical protein